MSNLNRQIKCYQDLFVFAQNIEEELSEIYREIDDISFHNTKKVMDAFAAARVSESCFGSTTGYGYDDKGRTVLEDVFAKVFSAEAALVRPQFINGTHTIACGLYGVLRTGDTFVCATGMPYDTLHPVIFGNQGGSLAEYGVSTFVNDLNEQDGHFDMELFLTRLKHCISKHMPKAALVQRSKGYACRPTFSPEELDRIAKTIKSVCPTTKIVLDNCYGEFVCKREVTVSEADGFDLVCGSLIKNPGGSLAPTGGYIVGTKESVENAACRLCVPGIGSEAGSYAAGYRLFFQGLFFAPHVVSQAVKTAVFASALLKELGFDVYPDPYETRNDIIQTITFGKPEPLLAFMNGIQAGSPVDSFVTPEPWDMPGYADPVVMAAGTFISGASIELSADAPMRAPFTAYMQGGVTYESGKLGILRAVAEIIGIGLS